MKTKREMTLGEALDEIASVSDGIRSSGVVAVDGREFSLDHPVVLEIESEAGKKAELEFEIKFRQEPGGEEPDGEEEPRRGGRAGFIVGLLAAAAAAVAILTLRRRRRGEDED